MRAFRLATILVAALLCRFSNALANPPVEAFGNLPVVTPPRLAPDAKHFATIQQVLGRPAVVIYAVNAPGVKPTVIPADPAIIDGVYWINSKRLLITAKLAMPGHFGATYTGTKAFLANADGSDIKKLSRQFGGYHIGYSGGAVLDYDADNPNYIYAEDTDFSFANGYKINIARVDIETGDARTIAVGGYHTVGWMMDGHGHVVGRIDYLPNSLLEHLMVKEGDDYREIAQIDTSAKGDTSLLGLSEDGKSLLITKSTSGRSAVYPLDIATGKIGDVLYSNPTYDVGEAIYSRAGRVVGVSYEADKTEYHYFDPARQALQAGLQIAFPGHSVVATSNDDAMNIVIVATDAPKDGVRYYYLDRTTHRADPIVSAYPALQTDDLGEMKLFTYAARDSLSIPAYLTLPPGKPAKNLPLVVFPHGGPQVRDSLGFDWWAQFMANRGYAVFQPNYRGSTGYGAAFQEKGFKQWGLAMQDDITDGVKALIADGTADPKRICIVGASYGGYAALAGAAFTPELYKCAVSVSGVSDIRDMMKTDMTGWSSKSPMASYIDTDIGNASSDRADLDAVSPALHADQIKIPVLLMHGRNDSTVQFSQSEKMRDALNRAGHPPTFVVFDQDDHNLSLPDTRIKMLQEIETFLDKNIGH